MRSIQTEHRAQRHTIRVSVLALLLAQLSPAWAAENMPSQTPLLNRTNLVPAPNVMLTLDDSGSMTYQYLPERTFTLNGHEVQFPNDGKVYLHPRELTENRFTFKDSGYSETRYVTATNFALSGNTAMQLTQAQMRSPQVNKLYYNPYLTYKPWKTAAGREYLPASPSKAWLRPERLLPDIRLPQAETDYVDLTSETGTHSVQWYCREDGHWTGCGRSTALAYSPALLYMLNDGANPNEVSSYVAYNLNTTSSFTWPAGPHKAKRDDCTKSSDGNSYTCTQDQEQKNFANWFVFYRSRLLVAQGTMPEALQSSVGDIRLGWGTIHPRQIKTNESETWTTFRPDHDITGAPNVPSYTVQQGVRTLNSAHLTEFTNWIRNDIKPERRTPTLNAVYSVGEYFKREDRLSPWQNDMTADPVGSPPFECRRSFHLLVTDGYYQSHDELSNAGDNMFVTAGMTSLPEVGNADANATADDGTFSGSRDSQGRLRARKAFSDNLSNTLADYAMSLWLTDLQPGIANKVPPINFESSPSDTALDKLVKEVQSNPATWQHLTHLTVGFGVYGTLDNTDETRTKTTLTELVDFGSSTRWPTTLDRIDDLWHAAVNSRGVYSQASNPDELQKALKDALKKSQPEPQKEAGLATASFILTDDNVKYVPEYDPQRWTGELTAYPLNINGQAGSERIWRASDWVPSADSRNVAIWQHFNGPTGTVVGRAVRFNYANLDSETQATLGSEALVDYIKGAEPSNTPYRKREGKLPDFVNSTPLFVNGGIDLGYGSALSMAGHDAYNSYLDDKRTRPQGLLFIGGNGGMLHVFRTGTAAGTGAGAGTEEFAFIPRMAVPKLPALADPRYGRPDVPHQYTVDGPLMESDVYMGEPRGWQNIVVGTMGAGGKSVFALELPTAALTLSESNVMWEANHPDMGYITTSPQVGRIPGSNDNAWKVFVGNGLNSDTGKTALLVIDVKTGAVQSYPVDTGDATQTQHGLGGVTLVRDPASGDVRAVYAGDTRGRLWRFDVDSEGVKLGYSAQPLFKAHDREGSPQPIVASPLIAAHPEGGQVVVFNTGKLAYSSDASNVQLHSAYGVRDPLAASTPSATQASPNLTRSNLVQQGIESRVLVEQTNSSESDTFFNLSRNAINWSEMKGWVFDLKIPVTVGLASASTSFIYPKALYEPLRFGKSVLISAVKPGATVTSCDKSFPEGYAFLLKALTGASPAYPSLDVDGSGGITTDEATSSGFMTRGAPLRIVPKQPPEQEDGGCPEGRVLEAGDPNGRTIQDCNKKRIKDRVWRQLLNPPVPQ